MTKIDNLWCSPFPVQTLVQLPCREVLLFSYQCQYEQGREAKCGYLEVRGARKVEEDFDLRPPPWTFPQRWRLVGASGKKAPHSLLPIAD